MGIKVWCLSDEGYLLRFLIHQGKTSKIDNESLKQALLRLIPPFYVRNHLLVMDGLFCSPEFVNECLQRKFYCLGVVQPNHAEFPKSLTFASSNISRFQSQYLAQIDKKPVYFLTTGHETKGK